MEVKIKKLNGLAVIPEYAKAGDAGLDFTATRIISETEDSIVYGTDIAIEIPEGYVGLLFPRSSIRKYELMLKNSVGVIDSGYRGEMMATFQKTNGNYSTKYGLNERIFQLIIMAYPKIELVISEELSETERNEGGHGHTGK
jgi:dUTP pyrophosphatase